MFIFREDKIQEVTSKYKMSGLCKQVGLTAGYLSLVINRKKTCPKKTAYAIVKYFNTDAEIIDYFEYAK